MNENQYEEKEKGALEKLLLKYEDVFQDVQTSPPSRNCDHKIVLKEGTNL